MWTYQAPVADMLFLMTQALDAPASWAAMPAFAGLGEVGIRAEQVCDGVVANGAAVTMTGGKIFIAGGEHDLSDTIVHRVLCRLDDAPAGPKGLSLAIVPKILPDGRRDTVFCDGIEKKMGIKGSATCQMRFEAAQGWLIGEPNRGLAAMCLMMNSARLQVGGHARPGASGWAAAAGPGALGQGAECGDGLAVQRGMTNEAGRGA